MRLASLRLYNYIKMQVDAVPHLLILSSSFIGMLNF